MDLGTPVEAGKHSLKIRVGVVHVSTWIQAQTGTGRVRRNVAVPARLVPTGAISQALSPTATPIRSMYLIAFILVARATRNCQRLLVERNLVCKALLFHPDRAGTDELVGFDR